MVALTRIVLTTITLVASASAIPVIREDISYSEISAQITFNGRYVPAVDASPLDSVDVPRTTYSTPNVGATDASNARQLWSPQRLARFVPTRYIYFFKMR